MEAEKKLGIMQNTYAAVLAETANAYQRWVCSKPW